MTEVTRRSFLATAAAISLTRWLDAPLLAQTSLVRYDASTPEGKKMLEVYARAVARMMDPAHTPEKSPLSWLFQWYIHAVKVDAKGNSLKAAELKRVYGSATAPSASLANETWDTCQPHHPTTLVGFFLPWHRMYLAFFERIIRKVSGESAFTLPYWDYSTADTARHGIIPPEFRSATDAKFKALYRSARNAGPASSQLPNVNGGEPIDKYAAGALSLSALKQGTYLKHGALPGFNRSVEATVHNFVHGLVGNTKNMGAVPTAASDPVFWLHHCNIDRLWASWNKNGGKNPGDTGFVNQTFTFADENGAKPSPLPAVGGVLDTTSLGYTYQALEPAPAGFAPLTNLTFEPETQPLLRTTSPLGVGTPEAVFEMSSSVPNPGALRDRVANLAPRKRFYLTIQEVHSNAPSGSLFNVYLGLPRGANVRGQSALRAGLISFFGAAHTAAETRPDRFYSFDVTEILRTLRTRDQLSETPRVTLLPVSAVEQGVEARVEGVSLVEQ